MTEQEATDHLESLVGIDRAFRLMRHWQEADMAARPSDPWSMRRETKAQATVRIFKARAKNDGYSDEAINFYISEIQGH